MKKIYSVIITLFAIAMCYSQTPEFTNSDINYVNNIKYSLFDDCTKTWLRPDEATRQGRKSFNDSWEDLAVWKANHPEDDCMKIAGYGTARIDYSNKWKNRQGETVTVMVEPGDYSKDTTFYAIQTAKVFDSVSKARYFSILYKPDSLKRHVEMISVVAKDSIPKPLNCTECGVKKIKITFNETGIWNGTNFDITRKELSHSYADIKVDTVKIFSYIRSSDTNGMSIQTYAPFDWIFNYKTGDNYDPTLNDCVDWQSDWNRFPEYQAGNPKRETHYDVVYASLWRHTSSPGRNNKKCSRVGVENKITGQIYESEVHVNPDFVE